MYLVMVWLSIAVFCAVFAGVLFLVQSSRYQQRLATRFWQKVGLPMATNGMWSIISTRIKHRVTALMSGGLIGLLLCAGVLYLSPSLGSDSFILAIMAPVMFTCMAAFEVTVALRQTLFQPREHSSRLARPQATTLSDYVSPWRLRLAPAFGTVALVLCAGGLILGQVGVIDSDAFIRSQALPLLALALIIFGLVTAAEWRILRHQQPASDTLELAWDDAFRADTFRALQMFEATIAWVAVVGAGTALLQGLDAVAGTAWATGVGSQLFIWGYLVATFCFTFGQSQNYFRHRLWPQFSTVDTGAVSGDS